MKSEAGCEFVTSQIGFDPKPASSFLAAYQNLCKERGVKPLTVFVSLATTPSPAILSLIESLDVVVPARVRKRLLGSAHIGMESVKIAAETLEKIMARTEEDGVQVPLGVQIEQLGVNNDELSLELLDRVYRILK
jgi:5,10-methylenetetrahydrofolate reductase